MTDSTLVEKVNSNQIRVIVLILIGVCFSTFYIEIVDVKDLLVGNDESIRNLSFCPNFSSFVSPSVGDSPVTHYVLTCHSLCTYLYRVGSVDPSQLECTPRAAPSRRGILFSPS